MPITRRPVLSLLTSALALLPALAAIAVDYAVEEKLAELWHDAPINRTTVPRLSAAPTIDGKLDDDAWSGASTVAGFTLTRYGLMRGQERLTTGYSLAEADTTVLIGRTDDALHVAFRAAEPEIEALHLTYEGRDGRLWANDCVELFLQPDGETWFQFIADANGSLFDVRNGDRKWNLADAEGRVAGAVHKNEKDLSLSYWVVELCLPFSELGADAPGELAEWRANFCRERYAPRYKSYGELSSWTGVTESFGNREQDGYLVFTDAQVTFPALVSDASGLDHPFLGRNTALVTIPRAGNLSGLQGTVLTVTDAGTREAAGVKIEAGAKTAAEFEYTVTEEGTGFAVLKVASEAGELASRRLAFTSASIGEKLAEGIRNARALQQRADPDSGFGQSVGPYVDELQAMRDIYASTRDELLAATASAQSREQWAALEQRVRNSLRAGNFTVWTCSPYLPVGPNTYPDALEDVSRLEVAACVNEYENAVVNISNFTDEHMDFYIQGNIPFAACAPRSGFAVPVRSVIQNHERELGWTVRARDVASEDNGMSMPLLELGRDPRVHVRPYSTRQIWFTTHTAEAEPTILAGGKRRKPHSAALRIIPVSHDLAGKVLGIQLEVHDFRIPDIAELGVYSFNYSTPLPFIAKYKMNTFMLAAWPRPKLNEDGTIDIGSAAKRAASDIAKLNPSPERPYTFVLSYGYIGSFIEWAEQQGLEYMSPEWQRLLKEIYRLWIGVLKENGLDYDDFVMQSIDEAHGHQVQQLADTVPLLREVDPNVRWAMTVMASVKEMEAMAPYTDVWFNRNGQHWGLEFLKAEQAKGKPLYSWHMSGDPRSPVLSWTRTYGWRAEKHGFDNISYFVFSSSAYRWQGDEPIPTRMIEAWRDTVEDWQYFNALHKEIDAARQRGVSEERLAEAEAVIDETLAHVLEHEENKMPYFPADNQNTADRIEQARVKLAQAILAVKGMK